MRWFDPPEGGYDSIWFAYLRKSKGQAGIARQRRSVQAQAKQVNGWIMAEFVDEDRTAFINPDALSIKARDDYEAMLIELRRWTGDKPVGVMAYHANRIHRDVVEAKTFQKICASGRHLVSTVRSGNYDLTTATDRGRFVSDAARAESEVDLMSERWRDQKADAALQGRWLGGPVPFGWKTKRLEDDSKVLVLDKKAAKAIGRACRLVIRLGGAGAEVNLSLIARDWNERGIKRPRGGEWNNIGVRRTLLRPRNAGLMVLHKKIIETTLDGGGANWPAIVSVDDWRTVVAILTRPERTTSPGPKPRWFGSGLYGCGAPVGDGECGNVLVVAGAYTLKDDGSIQKQYRCSGDGKPKGVRHVSRNVAMLDALVEATLTARLSRKDVRAWLGAQAPVDVDGMYRAIKAQEVKLKEWRQQLDDPDTELTPVAFARVEKTILAKIESIRAEIRAASTEPLVAEILEAEDFETLWQEKEDDLAWRRAILDLFVEVVVKPTSKGRPAGWRAGQPYFDPHAVRFDWKPLGGQPAPD